MRRTTGRFRCARRTAQVLLLAGLLLAGYALPALAQTVTLRGFITDQSDGQPLQGANVVLLNPPQPPLGAVTNVSGFYQVALIPAGSYVVRISFIGYESFTDTLSLGSRPFVRLNLALIPSEEVLDEVVVGAEGAVPVQAGRQTARPADLARIPTPDASGDLASYLQTLPGVVTLGDQGGQLFIRGGTPAQNLVLVDGMLVYQPFHIVGFFSAFPEDLVSAVDVYAGGFGARYSGRISSVIDVSMREGNYQQAEGAASLSPFLVGVRVEGPLRKGGVSVLGAYRQSIIEHTAPTLLNQALPFRFSDLFLKLTSRGENSRCSLLSMHTYDRGRIAPEQSQRDDVFRWSNFLLGGRCLAFSSASATLFEVNSGVSRVSNDVGRADAPERTSAATRFHTDLDLIYPLGETEVRAGLFARMNWLNYDLADFVAGTERSSQQLLSLGGYAETALSFGERLTLTPGVALVLYPSEYPASLEPRLRMVWRPVGEAGGAELSAALGLYRQTIVGLNDERDAGSVFTAWTPAPVGGAPASALHALAGWQQRLGPWFRFATEGYYKRLGDLPVPIVSSIARFTTSLTLAEGDIYGVDTWLEFQRQPFYAYLGYGFSETTYEAADGVFGTWFGEPIPSYQPPHDRRHQVNAILSATLGRFTTSVRWQYGSGLPFTRALGFDEVASFFPLTDVRDAYGTPRVLFERPYQARLPTYHRLDLSVERIIPTRAGLLTVQVGAINAYDRNNLFYFDLFTAQRVDQLPLMPNLSLKLETK